MNQPGIPGVLNDNYKEETIYPFLKKAVDKTYRVRADDYSTYDRLLNITP